MQLVLIFSSFQGLHSNCVLEMIVYMESKTKIEDILPLFFFQ